ncbi:MAG: hypothetical protein Q8L15_18425 [Methylobacter sp.]|nr:hypothetical protein [Methylobacter sp.]
MYKIYIKTKTEHGSEVDTTTRTTTPSPAAAEAAFRELLNRDDLRDQCAAAVLSLDNRQLMYHRFDRSPGHADYVSPNDEIKLFHDI